MRSRPSSESSSSARSSWPEDIRSSAPVQKTFPTTAASSNTVRSPGGSASNRADTMARIVVGISAAVAFACSATDAASSSMKRGFPSPMRPISPDCRPGFCIWSNTCVVAEQLCNCFVELLAGGLHFVGVEDPRHLLHLGGEGAVRNHLAVGKGSALDHARASGLCELPELACQPCLADAGRAEECHE